MTPANFLLELVALLTAGINPAEAVTTLASRSTNLDPDFLADFERRLNFYQELGIPLSQSLSEWADDLLQVEADRAILESAFAAPKSTVRLVTWLPLLSLGVAQIAGLNPFGVLASNALAQISAALGALLLAAGWFQMRRMLNRARPHDESKPKLLSIFADSLLCGLSTKDCLERSGAFVTKASAVELQEAKRLADFAFTHGVALRPLIQATIKRNRQAAVSAARTRIEKLSVRVMIPLGLVVLPAFVLVGVAPVAIGLLADVRGV